MERPTTNSETINNVLPINVGKSVPMSIKGVAPPKTPESTHDIVRAMISVGGAPNYLVRPPEASDHEARESRNEPLNKLGTPHAELTDQVDEKP